MLYTIRFLDPNPKLCAEALCDDHLILAGIELPMLLSYVWRQHKATSGAQGIYLAPIQPQNPHYSWMYNYQANYQWTADYWKAVMDEQQYRFDKRPPTEEKFELLKNHPVNVYRMPPMFQRQRFYQPACGVPKQYLVDNNKKPTKSKNGNSIVPCSCLNSTRFWYDEEIIGELPSTKREYPVWSKLAKQIANPVGPTRSRPYNEMPSPAWAQAPRHYATEYVNTVPRAPRPTGHTFLGTGERVNGR